MQSMVNSHLSEGLMLRWMLAWAGHPPTSWEDMPIPPAALMLQTL